MSPEIAQFSLILQGFEYEICHKAGILNAAANSMSGRTYDHTTDSALELIDKFPDNQVHEIPDASPEALRSNKNVAVAHITKSGTIAEHNEQKQQAVNILESVDMSQPLQFLFSQPDDFQLINSGFGLQPELTFSDGPFLSPKILSSHIQHNFPSQLNHEAPACQPQFPPLLPTEPLSSPVLSTSMLPLIPEPKAPPNNLPPNFNSTPGQPGYHTWSYTK